jgi:hypothetical protein
MAHDLRRQFFSQNIPCTDLLAHESAEYQTGLANFYLEANHG